MPAQRSGADPSRRGAGQPIAPGTMIGDAAAAVEQPAHPSIAGKDGEQSARKTQRLGVRRGPHRALYRLLPRGPIRHLAPTPPVTACGAGVVDTTQPAQRCPGRH